MREVKWIEVVGILALALAIGCGSEGGGGSSSGAGGTGGEESGAAGAGGTAGSEGGTGGEAGGGGGAGGEGGMAGAGGEGGTGGSGGAGGAGGGGGDLPETWASIAGSEIVVPLSNRFTVLVAFERSILPDGPIELSVQGLLTGVSVDVDSWFLGAAESTKEFRFSSDETVVALDEAVLATLEASTDDWQDEVEFKVQVAAQVLNTDDDGPGSLRATIALATGLYEMPTIRFLPTAFPAHQRTVIPLASPLGLSKNVRIEGPKRDGEPAVHLEAPANQRVLSVASGTEVELVNLAVVDADFNGQGGCIYDEGSLLLEGVLVRGCKGTSGGGVYVHNGELTVMNSRFENNEAKDENGGAIFCRGKAELHESFFLQNKAKARGGAVSGIACQFFETDGTFEGNEAEEGGAIGGPFSLRVNQLDGSTFLENEAVRGGALFLESHTDATPAAATIVRTLFQGNQAREDGGAVYALRARFTIEQSAFIENEAVEGGEGRGGGICFVGTASTITNSTFVGNRAKIGGALRQSGMRAYFYFSTIANNHATVDGGGLWYSAGYFRGNVVANNTADGEGTDLYKNGGSESLSFGYNFFGDIDGSVIRSDFLKDEDQTGDPRLGALGDNGGPTPSMAPLQGSPLVDAVYPPSCLGDGDESLTVDQRGTERPKGFACDIGAIEAR